MKTMIETRLNATSAILLLWALPAVGQAQFNYTTNNGTITITGYTGPGGALTIPAIITGLPVTSIGDGAFSYCSSPTAITVQASNPAYRSVDGVLFNKNQTALLQYPAGEAGSQYTIPNSVTSIGSPAIYRVLRSEWATT